jgi:hypothetical protein
MFPLTPFIYSDLLVALSSKKVQSPCSYCFWHDLLFLSFDSVTTFVESAMAQS